MSCITKKSEMPPKEHSLGGGIANWRFALHQIGGVFEAPLVFLIILFQ